MFTILQRLSWLLLLICCSLPILAAGPISPNVLRHIRSPHVTTRTHHLRIPIQQSVNTQITREVLQTSALNTLPTIAPAKSVAYPSVLSTEILYSQGPFQMADATFDRLVSKTFSMDKQIPTNFPPSKALQVFKENSPTFIVMKYFVQETQELSTLAKTDQAHHNFLEGQLFDLLCKLEQDEHITSSEFVTFQSLLFPHSLAARLRWPEAWASSAADTTIWPFVAPQDIAQPKDISFQPDLVVLVVNDNEELAQIIVNQLNLYAGHVISVYDMQELELEIEELKQRNLRPHYIIADGAIGWNYTDRDIKLMLKKSFPEVSQEMGFLILSDGILDFYAAHNGYVSYVTRVDNFIPNLPHLIGGLEEMYHIQDVFKKIP